MTKVTVLDSKKRDTEEIRQADRRVCVLEEKCEKAKRDAQSLRESKMSGLTK